jgi:hypothetical protein
MGAYHEQLPERDKDGVCHWLVLVVSCSGCQSNKEVPTRKICANIPPQHVLFALMVDDGGHGSLAHQDVGSRF